MRSAEHRAAPTLANGKDTPPRNCVNDFATESLHCKAKPGRERHPLGTSRQVHTESCKQDRTSAWHGVMTQMTVSFKAEQTKHGGCGECNRGCSLHQPAAG